MDLAKYDQMVDRKLVAKSFEGPREFGVMRMSCSGFLGCLDFHVAYLSKVNINLFQVAMQTTAKVSRLVGTRPIELGTLWAIYFQGGTVISLLRSMDSSSNKLNVCGINSLVGMGCPATTTTTTTSPPDGTQVHAANVANEWQVQGGLGKLVMPAGTCKINPFEK